MHEGRGDKASCPQGMIPLALLEPETEAVVCEINGGRGFTRRLIEMGIKPGSRVSITVPVRGRLIVKVDNTRLALGRGMAHRIFVRK